MKNINIYEKNLKKKVSLVALSLMLGVSSLGLTGCKSKTVDNDEVVYAVEKDKYMREIDDERRILNINDRRVLSDSNMFQREYQYFVDLNMLDDRIYSSYWWNDLSGLSDEELAETNYMKEYVYPVRSGVFVDGISTKFRNDKKNDKILESEFSVVNDHFNIIIPDSYKWAEDLILDGEGFADSTIEAHELYGSNGNKYLYYEYNIDFVEGIPTGLYERINESGEFSQKYGTQLNISSGESINHKALYICNNDKFIPIYVHQTGLGSECENVQKELKGDISKILIPISQLDNKESKLFKSDDDFEKFLETEHMQLKKRTK